MVVALKSHGGSCCGARHIHGFDSGTEEALDTINAALTQAPTRRAVEVILNGNQVGRYPGILGRLAQLGFVYDGHWKNGNHDSDNYRFTRCDDRRPLTLAGWTGMVMDPALTGTLPALPGQTTAGGGVGVVRDLAHYCRPLPENAAANAQTRRNTVVRAGGGGRRGQGVRYRINSPRSRYNGQEFICLGSGGRYDRLPTWRFRHPVDGVFEISQSNCSVAAIQDEGARPAWDRAFVVGDRVQVARTWDNARYPLGLCGTVTGAGRVSMSINIQFDHEGYAVINSGLEFIHLVVPGTQPDVPRERIQPPVGAAPANVPDQRHTLDGTYPRTYPIPAAPAPGAVVPRTPGTFVVGERVVYVEGNVRPHGSLGTVARISGQPPEILYHVNWDDEGQGVGCFGRRLRLAEAPPAPPPAPEVREVRVEVPVEPRRTIIASTYHCVFRNGNRGAGYDTLEEARAALGRRTRIDRREFFNTAPHMRWVENVPY